MSPSHGVSAQRYGRVLHGAQVILLLFVVDVIVNAALVLEITIKSEFMRKQEFCFFYKAVLQKLYITTNLIFQMQTYSD